VVPRNLDETGAGGLTSKQRTHDLGVLRTPEEAACHGQRVNDIADEDNGFGFDTLEKLVELARPGALIT